MSIKINFNPTHVLALLLVILSSPALYYIGSSTAFFSPDSVAYIAFSKIILSEGFLFLPSWGHIDSGLILPPAMPFIIGVLNLFNGDAIINSEIITKISILLASIALFFLCKKHLNTTAAVLSVALLHINQLYSSFWTTPLTEPMFLLFLTLALLILHISYTRNFNPKYLFALGIVCSLAFFSRQIGIVLIIFCPVFIFIKFWLEKYERIKILHSLSYYAAGVLLLMIPYTVTIYIQTDEHPINQQIRLNQYVVNEDKSNSQELERLHKLPENNYEQLYLKRRELRKLTDKSDEMYQFVVSSSNESTLNYFFRNIGNPILVLETGINNLVTLKNLVGITVLLLFFTVFILNLRNAVLTGKITENLILPSFVVIYMACLALLTDQVIRYVTVIAPLILVYVVPECTRHIVNLHGSLQESMKKNGITLILTVALILLTPAWFKPVPHTPYASEHKSSFSQFKNWITDYDPIFTFHPMIAYLSGGSYRIVPNDSLEKIKIYAEKTGVNLLLIAKSLGSEDDAGSYSKTDWTNQKYLHKQYPFIELVKEVDTATESYRLYRFKKQQH